MLRVHLLENKTPGEKIVFYISFKTCFFSCKIIYPSIVSLARGYSIKRNVIVEKRYDRDHRQHGWMIDQALHNNRRVNNLTFKERYAVSFARVRRPRVANYK